MGGNTTTSKKGALAEQVLEELLENQTTKKYFNNKDIVLLNILVLRKAKTREIMLHIHSCNFRIILGKQLYWSSCVLSG